MTQIVSYNDKKVFKFNSDNTRKVLDAFLQEPEEHRTYKDLRRMLSTGESQIRSALLGLERLNILEAEGIRGRPKGGNRLKNYHISLLISKHLNHY